MTLSCYSKSIRATIHLKGQKATRSTKYERAYEEAASFDAYLKFIEDDFLSGQRLDPKTDGRPDPRPDVRENASILGNLLQDFDFSQSPRPALLLSVHPTPGPASTS